MSLLRIVHHSYHPRSGVMLSEDDGTWKLVPPVAGATTRPGLVIYRFGAALFYANATRFADEVLAIVGPSPRPVRWLIVDGEAITNIDYSAARVVEELKKNLTAAGVGNLASLVCPPAPRQTSTVITLRNSSPHPGYSIDYTTPSIYWPPGINRRSPPTQRGSGAP